MAASKNLENRGFGVVPYERVSDMRRGTFLRGFRNSSCWGTYFAFQIETLLSPDDDQFRPCHWSCSFSLALVHAARLGWSDGYLYLIRCGRSKIRPLPWRLLHPCHPWSRHGPCAGPLALPWEACCRCGIVEVCRALPPCGLSSVTAASRTASTTGTRKCMAATAPLTATLAVQQQCTIIGPAPLHRWQPASFSTCVWMFLTSACPTQQRPAPVTAPVQQLQQQGRKAQSFQGGTRLHVGHCAHAAHQPLQGAPCAPAAQPGAGLRSGEGAARGGAAVAHAPQLGLGAQVQQAAERGTGGMLACMQQRWPLRLARWRGASSSPSAA